MKKILIVVILLIYGLGFSQVGIGTTSPETDAILDLTATDKALLLPRVANTAAIANPVNGMLLYDISSECVKGYENGSWTGCLSSGPPAVIASLDCAGAVHTGTLADAVLASGVSSEVSYTDGNGLDHTGQIVTSTEVTGLTATLDPGTLATGAGTLTYTITGTPSGSGTARFLLDIGGQMCNLNVPVNALPPGPITFANCETTFTGITTTSQAEYNDGARVIEIVNIDGTTTYDDNLASVPNGDWTPQGVLYSESNFDSPCTSTKANVNSAATWTNTARNTDVNLSGSGGLVLDLQSFKDVDFVSVFNTPSDGKITHFKLDYSTSATAPTYADEAAWTNIVPTTQVNDIQATGDASVLGTSLTFSMSTRVNARYWRLRVWNTGLWGTTGDFYIEIRQVKLSKFN